MPFSQEERDRDLCRNIVEAYEHMTRYIAGLSRNDFLLDSKTQDAVTMRLQQALESASKLSSESKSKLNIDWSSLTAMRNKISHSYVDIDVDIVWEVVNEFEEFQRLIYWAKQNI